LCGFEEVLGVFGPNENAGGFGFGFGTSVGVTKGRDECYTWIFSKYKHNNLMMVSPVRMKCFENPFEDVRLLCILAWKDYDSGHDSHYPFDGSN
jgi:hypothetical protein